MGNVKLNNLLYEDDPILISETGTSLHSCLDDLRPYVQKRKLTVNSKKTEAMTVKKRQYPAQMHCFNHKKEPLETKHSRTLQEC